ncbi:MAG: hypothetical protein H5T44_05785 [Thermoplasmatales archaeon]|nr:hypothetical protein [Thermoplasmatales archaeon]
MKRMIAILILILLLSPVGSSFLIKKRVAERNGIKPNGYFLIYTRYNGIEKYTPLLQSFFGIDIDNNASTGENGKDIRISLIFLPLIQSIEIGPVLTLAFAMKVIRMGEEIKNGEIEISFSGAISSHKFKIGCYSPENEEMPKEIREVFWIIPYVFYQKDPEFYINIEPLFDGENKNLTAIVEFDEKKLFIDYFPAVESMIKISPNLSLNMINFSIERNAELKQKIRMRYLDEIAVNLTIEDIPEKMSFSVSFSRDEKRFDYMANDTFNSTLIIEFQDFDFIMRMEYLPTRLTSIFNESGYFYIYIDEKKTTFILANAIENPSSYFLITNLTGESTIQWKISSEGYIKVDGFKGLKTEIKMEAENIYLKTFSIHQAQHFEIAWNLSVPGYIFIDTDNETLSQYSLNFSIAKIFGILIEIKSLVAEDFRITWQKEVPIFHKEGYFRILEELIFKVMINGTWYDVFG